MNFAQDLVQRIRGVIGTEDAFVPLHIPEFSGREKELLINMSIGLKTISPAYLAVNMAWPL
jgi:hypothetical protein